MDILVFAIVLLPLFAAVAGGLLKHWLGDVKVMAFTTASVGLSALLSFYVFYTMGFGSGTPFTAVLYEWINIGGTTPVSFGVMVDKLTATMLLVVSGVSACVHVYSWGYMAHDVSRARFFSYLSLFTFMMLALVSAPNMVQMFLGWEGVGLASYLLIGFWYHKPAANAAAMKAFIVNRVADLGLLLALFTTFAVVGSLNYADVFAAVDTLAATTYNFLGLQVNAAELVAFFLFVGAMGKSAQLGFHTWLPDAMEGPTPVSALIHAATMVTAGVFLLSRMSPVFEQAESVLQLVMWVGALTAIFAASIGLTQRDIKRVIAYSTCSQLGYMFLACGVSAYSAAMFHLTTHAFFKALLFLAAGSVIHGMHHEQDMFKMGAVKKLLPVTYVLMWLGSLALMGIPPFAGFFSKDLILESALMSGTPHAWLFYIVGVTAAFMTAFYSMRVLHLTFHGRVSRADKEVLSHTHESPRVMLWPMYVLAVGAVAGGFLLKDMGSVEWWNGAIRVLERHPAIEQAHHTPALYKFLPLVVVALGVWAATRCYIKHPEIPQKFAEAADIVYKTSYHKWYVDELYHVVLVRPLKKLAFVLWRFGDVLGIDRFGPGGATRMVQKASLLLKASQTGHVYTYAFVLLIGVCAMLSWMMLKG